MIKDWIAKRLARMIMPQLGTSYIGSGILTSPNLPGSQFDYRSEAGNLWENSIIALCLNWMIDNYLEAPPIAKEWREGKWVADSSHEYAELMMRPNPVYDRTVFWGGMLFSLLLNGDAYGMVLRDRFGIPRQIYWTPHWMMAPAWEGNDWITCYLYRVNGKDYKIPVENVLHLRYGAPHPYNIRRTISPCGAILREICGDNYGATLQAAFMRNPSFPSMVIGPDPAVTTQPTREQRKAIEEDIRLMTTGDNAGSVYFSPIPMKTFLTSPDPKNLDFTANRRLPEDRIIAAFKLNPAAIGLRTTEMKYTNYQEAKKAAYYSALIPLQSRINEQVAFQLAKLFDKGQKPGNDYDDVQCLQESMNDVYKRYVDACGGPFLTVNEARQGLNYKPIKDGDELRGMASPEDPKDEEDEGKDKEKGKGKAQNAKDSD